MEKLVGRKEEISILDRIMSSGEAELVAVYGRRRVGKTFLIHSYLKEHIAFELTGMYEAGMKEQLIQFGKALQEASGKPASTPSNWIEAFHRLSEYLRTKNKRKRVVVFLDEFPWLDSRKSGFLSAFGHFWNTWAGRQSNIVVIICGSAASWMIKNIVNNKGGLHNRVTQIIRILPFSLAETELYLKSRGIDLNRYHILQIYMAFGGIPLYLKHILKGNSAAQVIDKVCFTKDGFLRKEFDNLYHSLFEKAGNHINVVKALSVSRKGLTRHEIIKATGLSSGGGTSQILEELEESGFIDATVPYDKQSRDVLYRLTDEFSLFYLRFMNKRISSGSNVWLKLSTGNSYKIWCGMAFEAICLKHAGQLKKALGIEGIITEESSWRYPGDKEGEGAQIDLLIDRSDRCINICEMKFYSQEYTIDKAYAAELERKLRVFREKVRTPKLLFLTMVTTFGVKHNLHFTSLVQKELTMDALFEP